MRVLIIGAGLIGITTAYFMSKRGHDVTVVDRREGPGLETSFANGGLLTPSMSNPWNAPGCWRVLLGSLGRSDAALQLRIRNVPALAAWGTRFLLNSRPDKFRRDALANLRLGLRSLEVMESIRRDTGIEYGRLARGSLRLFRDRRALEQAAASDLLTSRTLAPKQLGPSEVAALEPALRPIADELAGAIHYAADEVGDAYVFCSALAEWVRKRGVEFRFGTEVNLVAARSGRAISVTCGGEPFHADHYLVAAGSHSGQLLGSIGVRVPIQPAKGYSITMCSTASDYPALGIPIVDDDFHAAVVPIGNSIRVAGTAEFAGYDTEPNPTRIRNLLRLVRQVLPDFTFNPAAAKPWSGLRAMSPDGVPIIGSAPVHGLWVNTAHGHLGWTMAAGSAELISDLIEGRTPETDSADYALARFRGV